MGGQAELSSLPISSYFYRRRRPIFEMANKAHPPELKKYMDHQLTLKLNGNRTVSGIMRGFDPFMNLVIDEAVEHCKTGEKNQIEWLSCEGTASLWWKATSGSADHVTTAGERGCTMGVLQ